MARESAQQKTDKQNVRKTEKQDLSKRIDSRRSQELVIGLCGAIGSGVKSLKNTLIGTLTSFGYEVKHIRVSKLIIDKQDASKRPNLNALKGAKRYTELQDLGDQLRMQHENHILACCAVTEISYRREEAHNKSAEVDGNVEKPSVKIAYIVDQLKHPSEVEILRKVYPKNFFLFGLIRTEKERVINLEEEGLDKSEIDDLIRRDRKSDDKYGQQVEKTLESSDFFIRNTHNQSVFLERSVERFIKLIHGYNGITPTEEEVGMHAAYSASLRSACLSRQVGAAIVDKQGRIIATGCNDVPEYGGGLYTDSSSSDFRCVHKGRCSNDQHKNILKEQILDIVKTKVSNEQDAIILTNRISEETKIKSLIEYSRAIHAEMDAIVSLSRLTTESTIGSTLYATTYPCHNCARHIVAAGIHKVVYIEPYEKSLAIKLHQDAITDISENNKVIFNPFEGVSPDMFERFFKSLSNRKDEEGKAIRIRVNDLYHVDSQYLDSYFDFEAAIAEDVEEKFKSPIPAAP
ncbi:anti-phage dCTP deaminase [Shewanella sp. GXUN23E]|uniref:anti-phage dCTP deaminase n=1 Tax=Shewanella sp. GXUN23E TaxID=3422498 RepID=UPI003D7E07A9